MNAVAPVQFRSLDQGRSSVFDDGEVGTPFRAQLKKEPYYSNKEITILHSVVSSAQDQLDRSPYPKPLPAAVLFKAYDDILPSFGIDPDSDHHLSALVFRIGGEHGNGSLQDKFQAILKRMGIVLEFDKDATVSEGSFSSARSPSPGSHQPQTNGRSHNHKPLLPGDAGKLASPGQVVSEILNPQSDNERNQSAANVRGNTLNVSNFIPPSVLDWQHTRKQLKRESLLKLIDEHVIPRATTIEAPGENARDLYKSDLNAGIVPWRKLASTDPRQPTSPVKNESVASGVPGSAKTVSTKNKALQSADNSRLSVLVEAPVDNVTCEANTVETDVLFHRAARARQIFLASRILNRWADQTAVRLNREATARRHMIRFRCFNSWTQAPSSNMPMVRHLKALCAIQKLQRTVACQEEQLDPAASLIARAHKNNQFWLWLKYWQSYTASQAFIEILAKRKGINVLHHWLQHTCNQNVYYATSTKSNRNFCGKIACNKWIAETKLHRTRQVAAKRVGAFLNSLHVLQKWLSQTEVTGQAVACRHLLTTQQVEVVFEFWIIRARAQAFRCRVQKELAVKYIHAWSTSTLHDKARRITSDEYNKVRSATVLTGHLREFGYMWQELGNIGERARWFIRATSLLRILKATAKHRKRQVKLVVRRYLMMRYTQVSSKRRRRTFFMALDRWQVHASARENMESVRMKHHVSGKLQQRTATVSKWTNSAALAAMSQIVAINDRKKRLIASWDQRALKYKYREIDALGLLSAEKQRQSLKFWTKSALQKSGQAHTANMVQQRHKRESRNRAVQIWRQSMATAKDGHATAEFQSPVWGKLSNSSRKTPRTLSRWRPLLHRIEDEHDVMSPVQTPSRSTGVAQPETQVLPLRFMDPAVELDGDSAKSDVDGNDDRYDHSHWAGSQNVPSTTPKAPIPSYIDRPTGVTSIASWQKKHSLSTRSARVRPALSQGSQLFGGAVNGKQSRLVGQAWSRQSTNGRGAPESGSSTPKRRAMFANSVPLAASAWQPASTHKRTQTRTPGL